MEHRDIGKVQSHDVSNNPDPHEFFESGVSSTSSSLEQFEYHDPSTLGLNPNYHFTKPAAANNLVSSLNSNQHVQDPGSVTSSQAGNHHSSTIRASAHLTDNLDTVRAAKVPSIIVSESINSSKAEIQPVSKSADWTYVPKSDSQSLLESHAPNDLRASPSLADTNTLRRRPAASERAQLFGDNRSRPTIQARKSSLRRKARGDSHHVVERSENRISSGETESTSGPYVADFKNSSLQYHPIIREVMGYRETPDIEKAPQRSQHPRYDNAIMLEETEPQSYPPSSPTQGELRKGYSLKHRHHFEIHEPHGFSLSRSYRRAPIARDWKNGRKRFVAMVACVNTALLGIIIGTYAGEVPAIQYTIADEHHYAILVTLPYSSGWP